MYVKQSKTWNMINDIAHPYGRRRSCGLTYIAHLWKNIALYKKKTHEKTTQRMMKEHYKSKTRKQWEGRLNSCCIKKGHSIVTK